MRSNVGAVNFSLEESVVHRSVSSVNEGIVVIAESQGAIEIENRVTISVSEVISLG
jgi:hypothetical protein